MNIDHDQVDRIRRAIVGDDPRNQAAYRESSVYHAWVEHTANSVAMTSGIMVSPALDVEATAQAYRRAYGMDRYHVATADLIPFLSEQALAKLAESFDDA